MPPTAMPGIALSRRAFVAGVAVTPLVAGGPLRVQDDARAREAPAGAGDIALLDALLGIEYATLVVYREAAACNLLDPAAQDAAARHAADHRAHRELLAATIRRLGGKPHDAVQGREFAEGAGWRSAAEAVDVIARHERAGADACLRFVPALRDRQLAKIVARIAADEAMHWTLLNAALGRRPPGGALSFGA